jgi:hypothetical protein
LPDGSVSMEARDTRFGMATTRSTQTTPTMIPLFADVHTNTDDSRPHNVVVVRVGGLVTPAAAPAASSPEHAGPADASGGEGSDDTTGTPLLGE